MPNRPGNDDRITSAGNDQRDASGDNSRQSGSQGGATAAVAAALLVCGTGPGRG